MTHEHQRPSSRSEGRVAEQEHREKNLSDDSPLAQVRHTVGEAIRIILLRRWAFFVPFCLVATLAAVVSHQVPRKYKVTTTFERRDNPVLTNLPAGGSMRLVKDTQPTVTRNLQHIDLMEEVLDGLTLTQALPRDAQGELTREGRGTRRALAAGFVSGITVGYQTIAGDTPLDTITITCEGTEPRHLADVCNGLCNLYIRKTRARMTQGLTETHAYFVDQATQCQQRITELNRARLGQDMDNALVNLGDPQSLLNRISSFQNERDTLRKEQDELQARLEACRQNLDRVKGWATRSPSNGPAADRVVAYRSPTTLSLQGEIQKLDAEIYKNRTENKRTLKHPDVQELLRTRETLAKRMARQMERDAFVAAGRLPEPPAPQGNTPSPSDTILTQMSNVEMEIKTLTDKLERNRHTMDVVQANLADYEKKKSEVFDNFQKHEEVTETLRSVQLDYAAYHMTANKLASLLTADENERAVGFTVLQPARFTQTPSNPGGELVLAVCLLLGAVSGVCGVLLAEVFDHSFHTTRQVTRSLGLAVLECIDEIVTAADRAAQFRRRILLAPALMLGMAAMVAVSNGLAYLSLKKPGTFQRAMSVPERLWDRATVDQAQTTVPPAPGPAPEDENAVGAAAPPARTVLLVSRTVVPLDDLLLLDRPIDPMATLVPLPLDRSWLTASVPRP